ncbi:MAG: hypothetical protein ACD_54C00671G0002 [uncultured bacterium]|nr:MAG: hypothetical protein ACD_54C00671G0002 [uncultured bacterium]
MGLHRQHAVIVKQRRVGAKFVCCQYFGIGGLFGDLIAVPGVQRQVLTVEIVIGGTNRPAAFVAFHFSAHGLRDDLVAKADAHHRHMRGVGVADELFQRRDPRVVFIDTVPRAGDQPAVAFSDRSRKFVFHHPVGAEAEAMPRQKPREHIRVVARLPDEAVGCEAGLQDADQHEMSAVA